MDRIRKWRCHLSLSRQIVVTTIRIFLREGRTIYSTERGKYTMELHDSITDVPGISVGHDTNLEAGTGCTVVLCDPPMIGGVDVRGGAPATRETDLLRPMHLVNAVN